MKKISGNVDEYLDIITKVFYNQKEYLEINMGDHIAYYKENDDHTFSEISKELYEQEALGAIAPVKVDKSKKASHGIFNKVKSVIVAFVLATSITSQLTGCSTNTTNDKNITVTAEPSHIPTSDGTILPDYTKITDITLEDLPKYGIEAVELPTGYDNCSEYYIKSIDTSKLPKNSILNDLRDEKNRTFIYQDDVEIANIDINTVIDNINNSKINKIYKDVLIDAVKEIIELGNEKMNCKLLYNISRFNIHQDAAHPTAETSAIDSYMKIGDIKNGSSPQMIEMVKAMGASDKDISVLKEYVKYILTHECCHAATFYYNDDNNVDIIPRRAILLIDNDTHKITDVYMKGNSLTEAIADYLQYEVTKIPSNQYMGYSINTTMYIALFDMLGIDNIEQLADMDVVKLIDIAGDKCMLDISNILDVFDAIENNTLSSYYTGESIDYTEPFCALLGSYIRCEKSKGTSNEEIINMIDKIEKDITDRVLITYDDQNNKYILGSFILESLDLTSSINVAKEYVMNYENETENTTNKTK